VTSLAESMSFRFDSDDNGNDNECDRAGSELLLCGGCGAQLTMSDATVGRYRALRELTPQPNDDVIESRDRQATESSSLRHELATTNDAPAKVVIHNNNVCMVSGCDRNKLYSGLR